jgi:hypothetical protein
MFDNINKYHCARWHQPGTVARLDEVKNGDIDASAAIKMVGAIDIANVSLAVSEKRNKNLLSLPV